MLPEELAVVDSAIESYKAALLKVGSLKRLNRAQREQLARAHSIIFGLLAQMHGTKPLTAYADDKEGHARAWRQVAYTLRKVDPLWHTRGGAGVEAAQAAVARLVDPDAPVSLDGWVFPNLRHMACAFFSRIPWCTDVTVEAYFDYLANRDVYKE